MNRINPKQNVWNQMFCFLIYASNEMAADGEVTGHKLQLGEVGRSSLAYQLNESYEFTLCVV